MRDSTWERTPSKVEGKPILCARCGLTGGTLKKQDEGVYAHQDTARCGIMKLRRKANGSK